MANVPTTKLAVNPRFDATVSPAIAKLIGFRLVAFGGGEASVELNSGPQHYNPMGTVHGGVLCDIADAAMGMAFASTLDADQSIVMKEMAKHVPDAGSYAPVTVLVDERRDGGHLSYDKMASLLAPYGNAEALHVARDLDSKIENLLREAVV